MALAPAAGSPLRAALPPCVTAARRLPYSAGETAIREFFSGYTAFAEFATREEALQAMSKNGAYIGERYVRLLHVPKQEMQEQVQMARVRLGTIAIPGNAHRRSRLQQQAVAAAAAQSFAAQQHAAMHGLRGGGGGGGGYDMGGGGYHALQAYGLEAPQQLLPHGAVLAHAGGGPRVVEVHPGYAAMGPGPGGGGGMVMAHGPPGRGGGGGGGQAVGVGPQLLQVAPGGVAALQMGGGGGGGGVQMATMVAADGTPLAMANAHMGLQQVQMAPPHMALAYQLGGMTLAPQPRAPPGGGPPHLTHYALAPHAHMAPPGAPPGAAALVAAAPMAGGGGGGGYAMAPPLAAAPMAAAAGGGAPPPVMVIGTDSKTVKIRGLPFRATPLDIFSFFEGYDHIAESLQLGVDALGRPSGEAWLTFGGSDEALRAVRERNRHYLGNRYLELSLT
ncbi:MAG: hypothetical protein J3K34DRAFT_501516 [Monoraphidium minutum]|nr:MAG: hypothetical protein J3K34DRAFT_501516 [Monoraphidium minutum]